ncbi:hypothetical protein [Alishewanella tabrizica]|uniref:Lipoprotein n=1 Tax=Alishewanella tabrizica TaxID=671278 RepID=A0ABQ2WQS8_9ALTE|nr:hypothetical protein [Alishewanella tabrizica]GGW62924.1 hypothetical protein GCM10008111_18640 [Alishewanella tabrizica]
MFAYVVNTRVSGRLGLLLLAVLLSACVAPALLLSPQGQLMWAIMKPMVGLDPNEVNLFEQPIIKKRLEPLLGEHYLTAVTLLNTADEIKQQGPLFYVASNYTPLPTLAEKAGFVWNAETNQMAVLISKGGVTHIFAEAVEQKAKAVLPVWPDELVDYAKMASDPEKMLKKQLEEQTQQLIEQPKQQLQNAIDEQKQLLIEQPKQQLQNAIDEQKQQLLEQPKQQLQNAIDEQKQQLIEQPKQQLQNAIDEQKQLLIEQPKQQLQNAIDEQKQQLIEQPKQQLQNAIDEQKQLLIEQPKQQLQNAIDEQKRLIEQQKPTPKKDNKPAN